MTEDEMVGCYHWPDGYESEWVPGVGDGQGILASMGSDDEWSNWTELNHGKVNTIFEVKQIWGASQLCNKLAVWLK